MASAVSRRSPVIMATPSPIFLRRSTATPADAFTSSARAMKPRRRPSRATKTPVFPAARSSGTRAPELAISTPSSSIKRRLPRSTCRPSIIPRAPRPVTASNPSTLEGSIPVSRPLSTMALARGCSETASRDTATRSSSSCPSAPPAGTMSVTTGVPRVRVPVLSKITVVSWYAFSRLSPPLISMPFSAPRPVPTITAVGVASPMAHGQAMTSTETKFKRATLKEGSEGAKYHTAKVISAMTMTTGTKTAATLSAKR